DRNGAMWLNCGDTIWEQGIVSPPGASVSYRIPSGTQAFRCCLSVPTQLSSKAAIRFVVLADGKEVYKSAVMTSHDKPQSIRVPLDQARSLTLRVETEKELELPMIGVWGNPLVLR